MHANGGDNDGQLPGSPGYRNNTPNYFGGPDGPLKHDFIDAVHPHFIPTPESFYCPSQTNFDADTLVDPTKPHFGTYFGFANLATGPFVRFYYLSYQIYANIQPVIPGVYETIPETLDDPGDWVLTSDFSAYRDVDGIDWQTNHPSNYGAFPERPPDGGPLEGINVGTLDGAVQWHAAEVVTPQIPIVAASWWARW